MGLEDLIIEGDHKNPTIKFRTNGQLLIEGRAIPERPERLFDPLNEWIEKASLSEVVFTVRMEYFNTTVSKHLAMLFQKMIEKPGLEKIKVNWFYEEGDEDSYDSGILYKTKFSEIEFEFFVFQ